MLDFIGYVPITSNTPGPPKTTPAWKVQGSFGYDFAVSLIASGVRSRPPDGNLRLGVKFAAQWLSVTLWCETHLLAIRLQTSLSFDTSGPRGSSHTHA